MPIPSAGGMGATLSKHARGLLRPSDDSVRDLIPRSMSVPQRRAGVTRHSTCTSVRALDGAEPANARTRAKRGDAACGRAIPSRVASIVFISGTLLPLGDAGAGCSDDGLPQGDDVMGRRNALCHILERGDGATRTARATHGGSSRRRLAETNGELLTSASTSNAVPHDGPPQCFAA